jgi:PAS domain S-box-containing protein
LKETLDNLENLVEERTAELENAYKSLKEKEESLDEAQQMAYLGNWERNLVTGEVYWSDEMYRIYERNPQEPVTNFAEFFNYAHPDDRDYLINGIKAALNGKPFSIDHRVILANGDEHTVHSKGEVILDKENDPVRIRGTVQDITERKKSEEKLQESEEKYRNIVETANEGIVIINIRAIITYVNQKMMDLLGYSLEEGIGRPIWDFISEESIDIVKNNFILRSKGKNGNYELKLRRKDGLSLWVSANAKSLFDKDGSFMGSLSMLTDITKRKEAEEELHNIEIVRKKEIHHRIKNNLQVISSLLDLQAEKFRDRGCVEDSEVLIAFRESQERVMSIALIHEELHEGKGNDTLNFPLYLERLVKNLFQTYRLENVNTRLNIDLEENIFFDMDIAVPLGIITNELVSNSLKYQQFPF